MRIRMFSAKNFMLVNFSNKSDRIYDKPDSVLQKSKSGINFNRFNQNATRKRKGIHFLLIPFIPFFCIYGFMHNNRRMFLAKNSMLVNFAEIS